ncbi:MAG TPA: SPFH domain-containing protein [Polyangiaceae bacterium]
MLGMLRFAAVLAVAVGASGCATATIEPGHRGLFFAPHDGGLRREVLQPGVHKLGACFIACTSNRVDDFDVTYATKKETLQVRSSEGLEIDVVADVIYRPIVSELYELDTEIGPGYYEEVIGPEFRSAGRGVFAHRSYVDLERKDRNVEDELENELRRRTVGRHVEIASVTLERITYAPEIAEALRKRIAAQAEAARERAELELKRLREAPACAAAITGTR